MYTELRFRVCIFGVPDFTVRVKKVITMSLFFLPFCFLQITHPCCWILLSFSSKI